MRGASLLNLQKEGCSISICLRGKHEQVSSGKEFAKIMEQHAECHLTNFHFHFKRALFKVGSVGGTFP